MIFDWDGTLMDSTSVIAAALQSACRDIGIAVPTERDARFVIGLGAADTFRHVAPRLDADDPIVPNVDEDETLEKSGMRSWPLSR